jgi:ABC-type polysaccharide/polyol phosphate transport system ATPase subunit
VLDRGALRLEGVAKHYPDPIGDGGTVAALAGVDVRIEPGDAVGLIGANGAGKSTALKVAAGITAPTAGRVVRRGHTVAVIELGAGMHPDLTGRENLDLLSALSHAPTRRDVPDADEVIAFAELADDIDRRVRYYSTGMMARLAFAVAVHAQPEILLIDEVISVGDLRFQQRCLQRLFELRGRGCTLLVVSHDLKLIGETCDRTVLLAAGRVELDGPTEEVVDHYLGRAGQARAAELPAQLAAELVDTGADLQLELDVPDGPHGALRLEVVVLGDPSARAGGRTMAAVSGSTRVAAPRPGPLRLAIATRGLPSGRFELHATLEDSDHHDRARTILPFTLVGPPGPQAIRLDARVALDGQPLPAAEARA